MKKTAKSDIKETAKLVTAIHKGKTVKEAAATVGISYRAACRRLQKYSLTNKGLPRPRESSELTATIFKTLISKYSTAQEFCVVHNISKLQLKALTKSLKLKPEWNLAANENPIIARGRKAEELVRDVIFPGKLKKDSLTARKTGSRTAPYDLIISKLGAIDVKSTTLKGDTFKFTTRHSKQTKYLVLVGYDETGHTPLFAWQVSREEADGAQTIRIPHPSTGRQHKGILIWESTNVK